MEGVDEEGINKLGDLLSEISEIKDNSLLGSELEERITKICGAIDEQLIPSLFLVSLKALWCMDFCSDNYQGYKYAKIVASVFARIFAAYKPEYFTSERFSYDSPLVFVDDWLTIFKWQSNSTNSPVYINGTDYTCKALKIKISKEIDDFYQSNDSNKMIVLKKQYGAHCQGLRMRIIILI